MSDAGEEGAPVDRASPDLGDPLYAPHFAGLEEGEFRVQRWESDGALEWPPHVMHGADQTESYGWQAIPLTGVVYSYAVCYRAFHPWFALRVPYAIVVVDTDAGVRVLGNCFDPSVERLECGQRMRGELVRAESGIPGVVWRPAEAHGTTPLRRAIQAECSG
ncbi:Zn-ribbon domain-containing OB-fold protein [Agrococcus baldri]|uniref:ChsH2 C-terminal OB-fold domain-containing protein n=1 Tax=Agrococcus baldri TaxID=153730 RepID=A0AA87RJ25_9MICO|nr:OB-fold domain-containing protein [Agrococcus baldri]GEK79107.1 hypothetical protein ABA31_04580 [Agrococcus baldri]